MGVYCDKVVGYMVDVKKEWDRVRAELKNSPERAMVQIFDERWLDSLDKDLELDFITYSGLNINRDIESNIVTLLYDGMDEEYTYLVYILKVERYSDDEEQDMADCINGLLESVEVPPEIKRKIEEVYREMFEDGGGETDLDIRAKYVLHYH